MKRINKKGFVQDAFPIVTTIFVVAIILIIGLIFISKVSDGINQISDPVADQAQSMTTYVNDTADWVFDFLLSMLFISLPIISMILAYLNNIPSFFFFASIGLMLLVVIIGGAYSSAWGDMHDDDTLNTQINRMPITDTILSHYGMYSFFVMIIIISGTYVKMRAQSGYTY